MTARQRTIVKAILESLNALEGGQMTEPLLHAEVSLRMTPVPGRVEFEDGLLICEQNGWSIGVPGKFGGGKRWNLTDAGQAARLEMNRS